VSRRYDVVTFDCYGTLIDWETGIGNALAADASAAGHMISPRQCVEVYAEQEVQVEKEGFRKYREVLTEAARRTARRLGWEVAPERAAFLPRSLPFWQPFSDTNAALERLAGEGIRLGILSNVDEDLIAATRRHFTVPFELVVTAESVRSYKPGRAHFLTARRKLGDARWLHAAQSYFHDVVPAKALGIPIAWINRKKQIAGSAGPPDAEFPTLARFADWMTS
jgi:2-haloacid dehalogenase/putative hydrolase of the HAD superfamily